MTFEVTVLVDVYPFEGALALKVEEKTLYGWVEVLDEDTIGTFPNYVSAYEVTCYAPSPTLRYRWQTGVNSHSDWFSPTVRFTPTAEQTERFTQAVFAKAVRILMMGDAPLGSFGEMGEYGMARVLPDHQIVELLFGLRFREWDIDFTELVETDDVIRQGLSTDPEDFPEDRVPDVQRAIDAAASWVLTEVTEGVGVA